MWPAIILGLIFVFLAVIDMGDRREKRKYNEIKGNDWEDTLL